MGCDIHAYPEARASDRGWRSLGTVEINRNYLLFGHLAGVRAQVDPVAQPRGLPSDAGWFAKYDAALLVLDGGVPSYERSVSRKQAEAWVASGKSKWVDGTGYISDPDWHTHSWLTLAECREALRRAAEVGGDSLSMRGVVAMMETWEAADCETRLVFWFDN